MYRRFFLFSGAFMTKQNCQWQFCVWNFVRGNRRLEVSSVFTNVWVDSFVLPQPRGSNAELELFRNRIQDSPDKMGSHFGQNQQVFCWILVRNPILVFICSSRKLCLDTFHSLPLLFPIFRRNPILPWGLCKFWNLQKSHFTEFPFYRENSVVSLSGFASVFSSELVDWCDSISSVDQVSALEHGVEAHYRSNRTVSSGA